MPTWVAIRIFSDSHGFLCIFRKWKLEVEAFLRNPFWNGTPSSKSNCEKWQDLHGSAEVHSAPSLAGFGSAARPATSATCCWSCVTCGTCSGTCGGTCGVTCCDICCPGAWPGLHDAHKFPGVFGCKITLVPYNLQYVPFPNMPNTLGNALPLQSPPLQQQPLSAHADLGSSRSPLGSSWQYRTLSSVQTTL